MVITFIHSLINKLKNFKKRKYNLIPVLLIVKKNTTVYLIKVPLFQPN